MKKLLIRSFVALNLFPISTIYAQVQPEFAQKNIVSEEVNMPGFSNYTSTSKTTSVEERVIARTRFSLSGSTLIMNDSVEFSWHSGKTSRQIADVVEFHKDDVEIEQFDLAKYWYEKTSGFGMHTKILQTFNSDNLIAESIHQQWIDSTSSWEADYKVVNEYSGKNKIRETRSSRDFTKGGLWINRTQTLYTYSGANIAEQYEQIWDTATSMWQDRGTKLINTYTGGNLTEQITQYNGFPTFAWRNGVKEEYAYLGKDLTGKRTYKWNAASSAWINDTRYTCVNPGTTSAEEYNELWNTTTNSWDSTSKTHTKPITGKSYELEVEIFKKGVWAKATKITYLYSGLNLTQYLVEKWNAGTSTWENSDKKSIAYNANDHITSSRIEYWDGSTWQPYKVYAPLTNYYYETYTSIKEGTTILSKVNIYPNPATAANVYLDYFTQESEPTEVVLSNILGQEILKKTESASIGDHSVMIPVSNLSSGMYLVSIYCKGQLYKTMKLVK